jgi:hypothetical protein
MEADMFVRECKMKEEKRKAKLLAIKSDQLEQIVLTDLF